jgi:hypothetical protein
MSEKPAAALVLPIGDPIKELALWTDPSTGVVQARILASACGSSSTIGWHCELASAQAAPALQINARPAQGQIQPVRLNQEDAETFLLPGAGHLHDPGI